MSKHRIAAASAVALGVGFLAVTTASGQEVQFTFATTNGIADLSSQAMLRFEQMLEERSGGEIRMEFISGGALGGDQELLQQLATNEIQMHIAGPVIVHRLLPLYQCLEAEYVYEDEEHGMRVWTGELGAEVSDALKEQYGIEIVAIGARGARHVTSNTPIREPSDLEGVKIRVTNPLRTEVFAAYGALPGPLSISELYGALRQGVFDAEENPISTIYGNKFYEVQDFINLTGHVQSYNVITANSDFLESMTTEQRAIFDQALADATLSLNQAVAEEIEVLLQRMQEEEEVEVVEPDVAAFREVALPIVRAFAEENCKPGLLDAIQSHTK
ncbi:MAG: TRAP transporter substrate-binding protein [Geminicoccaceae bacterium]